jgi:uncharacterized protein YjbI with pentapeptide repeats
MSAQPLILKHDQWRKGQGGAPAGIVGESDGNAYAGLDLNGITFSASTFAGSGFSATTFLDASWAGCRFTDCTFVDCDMLRIRIEACSFAGCTLTRCNLAHCNFEDSTFTECAWNELNFDHGRWLRLRLQACTGTKLTGEGVRGQQVDFKGSRFQDTRWTRAQIN